MTYPELLIYIQKTADIYSRQSFSRKHDYSFTGFQSKRFYMLLILTISSEVTAETLVPLLSAVSPICSKKDPLRYASDLYAGVFSENATLDGIQLSSCYNRKKNRYKDRYQTFSITQQGLNVLSKLHSSICFPEEFPDIDISEITAVMGTYKKSSPAIEHRMQGNAIIASFLRAFPPGGLKDIAIERGRSNNFDILNRNDSASFFVPDISFRHGVLPYTPVMIETDMETERNSILVSKAFTEVCYGNVNHLSHPGVQPSVTLFIVGENLTQYPENNKDNVDGFFASAEWKLLMSAGVKSNQAFLSAFELLGAAVWESNSEDDEEPHTVTLDDYDQIVNRIVVRNDMEDFVSTCVAMMDYAYERNLDGADIGTVRKSLAEDQRNFLAERKADHKCRRSSHFLDRVRSKRAAMAEGLAAKDAASRFEAGDFLGMVPYPELNGALKTIFPGICGKDCVMAVLKAAGLREDYKKSWDCRPLLHGSSSGSYWVYLRNCFLTDGVLVFFEDISYDISALTRIREYLKMPSDLIYNSLLVIIIDDSMELADGTELQNACIYAGTDDDRTFFHCFREAYGSEGTLPFRYRKTNDFCFIKRSAFLSCQPEFFVKLGRTVYMERTPEGMENDERKIMFHLKGSYRGSYRFAGNYS